VIGLRNKTERVSRSRGRPRQKVEPTRRMDRTFRLSLPHLREIIQTRPLGVLRGLTGFRHSRQVSPTSPQQPLPSIPVPKDIYQVAVIGAGAIGNDHIESFNKHPAAKVGALAELSPTRGKEAAERF